MNNEQPEDASHDLARLAEELDSLRATTEALQTRLDAANGRARATEDDVQGQSNRTDTLEIRADEASRRASASEGLAAVHGEQIETLEGRINIDQAMIAELQADGLLSREHVEHLEKALSSSRKIGAAVGIVMASHRVDEAHAFQLLSKASQDTNRKLRVLAEDLLATGDVSDLRPK